MKSYLKPFAQQKFLNEIKNLKAFQSYCKINSHKMYHKKYLGTCHGDSGGPLFCEKDGQNILVGVTSYGQDSIVDGFYIF